MTRSMLLSFGVTFRRATAAGRRIPSRAPVAMVATSVLVLAASSCGGASSSGTVGPAMQEVQSFQAAAGDNQVGTAGSVLANPLTVQALTQGGKGVPGVSVQWTFSEGGGSSTANGSISKSLTTVTDQQGETSVYWQLDTIAGDQTATATFASTNQTSASSTTKIKFHSHGRAGGPASIVVSPQADTLAVGDSTEFAATVLDRWKNVISGTTVNWSSSDDSVVAVSSGGMAKANRSGAATVVATSSGASTISGSTGTSGTSTVSGQASVSVASSTTSTANAPGTISNLKVGSVTDSSVTLTWTQVDDGTGNPAKYALRYGTPTISWSADYGTEVSVNGTSIGATESYTFEGLQAGMSYQFQLVSYHGTLNVDAVFGGLSNVVSGLTTGGGALQTPTVTVTPASLSFTSIGATAQLSAVAKDSTGNTVTNPGFTWTSLATSIAAVSTTGLVTAKAVGAAAIIVTAACCGSDTAAVTVDTVTAPNQTTGTPYFQDGFEGYTVGSPVPTGSGSNGFSWQSPDGSGSIVVSTDVAHSGTKSLKVTYKGVPAGSDDWEEQYFDLKPVGQGLKEVWMEWWLYFPSNYVYRAGEIGNNNKLCYIWAETYSGSGDMMTGFEYQGSATSVSPHVVLRSAPDGVNLTSDASSNTDRWPVFDPSTIAGSWHRIRIHIRVGNNTTDSGSYQVWFDNRLVVQKVSSYMLYTTISPANNWLRRGYLMGWADAGFTNNTSFYVDDVKVYDVDPHW